MLKYKPGHVYSFLAWGSTAQGKVFCVADKAQKLIVLNAPEKFRKEIGHIAELEDEYVAQTVKEEFDLSSPEAYDLLCKLLKE